ncbi:MAG: helix-turn-helix domain-containing protein [Paracoccaceae bacterium]
MTASIDAYCYFQDIAPRAPMALRFERDYLLHAVQGGFDVQVGAQRWLLPPSFAAWLPAGTAFQVRIDRPVTCCSVLTQPGFANEMPSDPVAFQMSPLTRHMVHHCRPWGESDSHPAQARPFFKVLLATCADLVGQSIDVTRPHSADPMVAQALRFTEAHLADTLQTGDVARAAGFSERSMQRRFAEELGASWSETLTRIRMIRAVELLSESDEKVLSIAMACGYSSLSAFNRAFRAFAGQTPSAFRRSLTV